MLTRGLRYSLIIVIAVLGFLLIFTFMPAGAGTYVENEDFLDKSVSRSYIYKQLVQVKEAAEEDPQLAVTTTEYASIFGVPLEKWYISSELDPGREVFGSSNPHNAVDVSRIAGVASIADHPVYSPVNGVVEDVAYWFDMHSTKGVALNGHTGGNIVYILDEDGNHWAFMHLCGSKSHNGGFRIQKGTVVKAGDLIGHVGDTGTSEIDHLHIRYSVQVDGTYRYYDAYQVLSGISLAEAAWVYAVEGGYAFPKGFDAQAYYDSYSTLAKEWDKKYK